MEQTIIRTEFDQQTRRYYDTVTWLAEVLPGSMRTPFEYNFDGHELYAEDGGALRPIFEDSIEEAATLSVYERRRRQIELDEYEDMLAMARGELPNTMVVVSDFPPELMGATKDVGGYNAARKQTMLRVIARSDDGVLRMYSQSLDGSNRQALEAMYESLGYVPEPGELLGQRMHIDVDPHDQEFLIDQLMGVYDRTLGHGYYAGIKGGDRQNTYDFACDQADLVRAYLATTDYFSGGDADYNLAVAVRARYLNRHKVEPTISHFEPVYPLAIAMHSMALEEMSNAGLVARSQGVTVSGCGATISGRSEAWDPMRSGREQLEASGFGNKADKLPDDKYGSRYFKCSNGHQNVRWEKNKLLPHCQTSGCKAKVSC